jgi:hypothetical protein
MLFTSPESGAKLNLTPFAGAHGPGGAAAVATEADGAAVAAGVAVASSGSDVFEQPHAAHASTAARRGGAKDVASGEKF